MKKMSFLFLFALVIFAGCKKEVDEVEEKLFSFDITNVKPFTVTKDAANQAYAAQNFLPITYPVTGVSSSSEVDFKNNNTSTELVKNVKLQELILTMPDQATENFSFLEKMDIQIAMKDGSEPILMAYNRSIPTTPDHKLVFTPVADANMDKYVKAGEYQLILVDTRIRRLVTADMDITAKLTFKVTASPLN